MKLFEMKRRPKTAGVATLEFAEGISSPRRQGRHIGIPNNPETEFYPLERGKQFLVRVPNYRENEVWFGGTDEQPFLTRLKSETFMKFIHEGEKGFFDSLKPTVIVDLATRLNSSIKRQGDFFAVPLGIGWDELAKALRILNGIEIQLKRSAPRTGERGVFQTRHHLAGNFTGDIPVLGKTGLTLVSGVLEAPDHAPLGLDGPHILSQAAYLWSPPDTD